MGKLERELSRPLVLRHAYQSETQRYTPRRPERTLLYRTVALRWLLLSRQQLVGFERACWGRGIGLRQSALAAHEQQSARWYRGDDTHAQPIRGELSTAAKLRINSRYPA